MSPSREEVRCSIDIEHDVELVVPESKSSELISCLLVTLLWHLREVLALAHEFFQPVPRTEGSIPEIL